MDTMTADHARAHWSELMDTVVKHPVQITRRGKRKAVVVNPEFFDLATAALEDRIDLAAARAALDEGGSTIPAAELRRQLGL